MNDENTLEIIEQARRKVHETVNRRFDDLITLVQGGEFEIESDFELSLCDRPTYFKGKKPISVIYQDNTEFETPTWKKVAKQLLNECAGDAVMYDRLHRLCDKVSGRDAESILINRHAEQLRIYCTAVERITKGKIKKAVIFSFELMKSIEVSL